MIFSVPLVASLLSLTTANELALYWGQASAGSQKPLADYCQNSAGDIYIISFITTYGSGRQLAMNIAGYDKFIAGTQLLDAPELGSEIKTCQSLGKKVFISLGGAIGSYGFSSDSDAEQVATDLWNHFGGGNSDARPFGDAKIDGFDLDGENNLAAEYYVPFVNKLRQLYQTDGSKQYYTSAAPQCPFPDATLGKAVAQADLDYLFIQFYNNYCSLTGSNFNYDTWQSFASSSAPNKNVKLLVGLPGSPTAAGSGYIPIDEIKSKSSLFKNSPNFGGFMVWDASQADQNKVGGSTFAEQLKEIAGGAPAPAPQPTTSSPADTPAAPSTSTKTTSQSSAVLPEGNNANTVPTTTTTTSAVIPNFDYKESTSTTHVTSYVDTVIAQTHTITSQPPVQTEVISNNYKPAVQTPSITSAPAAAAATTDANSEESDCMYTTSGEVVVVKTSWFTQYTTVWI